MDSRLRGNDIEGCWQDTAIAIFVIAAPGLSFPCPVCHSRAGGNPSPVDHRDGFPVKPGMTKEGPGMTKEGPGMRRGRGMTETGPRNDKDRAWKDRGRRTVGYPGTCACSHWT